ncbi:hypothetical protein EVAR_24558_1 [Eumeta japonica]|uniref:Uncharacterized protein n=1 Tax=Eumeta variegata TaxID=151549 RepID=A0A4C1USC6_EUMVA|nr:hypothetical protein EVAR_24558_1 [Eumeta japonica]
MIKARAMRRPKEIRRGVPGIYVKHRRGRVSWDFATCRATLCVSFDVIISKLTALAVYDIEHYQSLRAQCDIKSDGDRIRRASSERGAFSYHLIGFSVRTFSLVGDISPGLPRSTGGAESVGTGIKTY